MATHASALKRARQSEKRRLRNVKIKSALKSLSKKVLIAKNRQEAQAVLVCVVPAIQKAVSKKVIHKKTAARKISRLTKKVNALTPQA